MKKVRFNEKVQVFIIQADNRRSTTVSSFPPIRFAQAKPLSEKLKEPSHHQSASAFGTRRLTPGTRRLAPGPFYSSEDLINFYLQRSAKQPVTYWNTMKANPSLAISPNIHIVREELKLPRTRTHSSTSFPNRRRFTGLSLSHVTTTTLQKRFSSKSGKFSEFLTVYGNNPIQRKLRMENMEGARIDEMHDTFKQKLLGKNYKRKTTPMFPYFVKPQEFTHRPVYQTYSSVLYR